MKRQSQVREDAGPFSCYGQRTRVAPESEHELRHSSRIVVRISRHNDRMVNVGVSGNVVEVLHEEIVFSDPTRECPQKKRVNSHRTVS